MKKRTLNIVLSSLLLFLLTLLIFTTKAPQSVISISPHVVISEIQLRTTASASDEFIELYNKSATPVMFSNWRLTKQPQDGTPTIDLLVDFSGTIPAHGFYLITSDESLASPSADQVYDYTTTRSLAADNFFTLYDENGIILDLVGLGNASSSETAAIDNPPNNGSVERKAPGATSAADMESGGSHEFAGNGQDTDDNSNDFIVRSVSQPQNSSASPEPELPSPTPSSKCSAKSRTNTQCPSRTLCLTVIHIRTSTNPDSDSNYDTFGRSRIITISNCRTFSADRTKPNYTSNTKY